MGDVDVNVDFDVGALDAIDLGKNCKPFGVFDAETTGVEKYLYYDYRYIPFGPDCERNNDLNGKRHKYSRSGVCNIC